MEVSKLQNEFVLSKKSEFAELKEYIDSVKNSQGVTMQILQKAQGIFGYLPLEVQQFISCYVKGSQEIMDKLAEELNVKVGKTTEDRLFTLEATRCLGCCGLAPVMMIDDDVYGKMEPKKIKDILKKYQ